MYNETHNIVLVKRKRHNILCFVCKCFIYEEITFKSNLTQKFNSYYQLIVIFLENVLSKWKISNDVNTTYRYNAEITIVTMLLKHFLIGMTTLFKRVEERR
ncbi:hypothetical protein NL782_00330, partial [Staphylococcus aureus]|nr:hypothetical protein [Staphylococcus aureus]